MYKKKRWQAKWVVLSLANKFVCRWLRNPECRGWWSFPLSEPMQPRLLRSLQFLSLQARVPSIVIWCLVHSSASHDTRGGSGGAT